MSRQLYFRSRVWFARLDSCRSLNGRAAQQPRLSTSATTSPQRTASRRQAHSLRIRPASKPSQSGARFQSRTSGFKIVTSVNEVNLIFTVTDKHGNLSPI